MKYDLIINWVDGETTSRLYTSRKELLLPFLEQYDHEGSNVSLNAVVTDEEVYKFLKEELND
jgi:hypothetical protein